MDGIFPGPTSVRDKKQQQNEDQEDSTKGRRNNCGGII